MCVQCQYCAYRHVSSMLERTRIDWDLAMFELEVYFDDSGTDRGTPVAVAACYVASKVQWDEFVKNWDKAREEEGFDVFHMAEFVAKPQMGHKPFCDWDNKKKERVYRRLASTINCRVRKGFALAVPKKPFDEYAFPEFKEQYAADHYTWAAKSVIGLLEEWRQQYKVSSPMQYVFDRGSLGQKQIEQIWNDYSSHPTARSKYGIVPGGVMFQDKSMFKPLQAADILAWQMQNHMRRTVMVGKSINDREHPGFRQLQENHPMNLGFYSTKQLRNVFDTARMFHQEHGRWPWGFGAPIAGKTIRALPGIVE
jgi:hypothetical protein